MSRKPIHNCLRIVAHKIGIYEKKWIIKKQIRIGYRKSGLSQHKNITATMIENNIFVNTPSSDNTVIIGKRQIHTRYMSIMRTLAVFTLSFS